MIGGASSIQGESYTSHASEIEGTCHSGGLERTVFIILKQPKQLIYLEKV